MRRFGLVLVALLLLGAGLLAVINTGSGNGRPGEKAQNSATLTSREAAKATRDRGERATTHTAAKRLRDLLKRRPSEAPNFAEVDRLARGLSEAELQELLAEIGFTGEEGLEGWVRSALFAEWGRRDPEAAWEYLREPPVDEVWAWAFDQAHFAVWRGWAEKDAAEAAARLKLEAIMADRRPGRRAPNRGTSFEQWRSYAFTEVFRQFARRDANAAWEEIAASPHREEALGGFFAGLAAQETLREYVDRWAEDWLSEEGVAAHEDYVAQLNGPRSGVVAIPSHEEIARQAALALAQFDLEAALAWIEDAGPGDGQIRNSRRLHLMEDWAASNPDRALALLASSRESDSETSLARGIIRGDPTRAAEAIAAMRQGGARARTLLTIVTGLGNHHVRDYFPTPHERNRLPDFEARYRDLLAAVEAGEFEDGQDTALRRAVHRSFENHVPAAKLAYEEVPEESAD